MSDLEISPLIKDLSDNYANNHISLSEYRYQRRIILQQIDCEFNQVCIEENLQDNDEEAVIQSMDSITNRQYFDPVAENVNPDALYKNEEDIQELQNESRVTNGQDELHIEQDVSIEEPLLQDWGSITNRQYLDVMEEDIDSEIVLNQEDSNEKDIMESTLEKE